MYRIIPDLEKIIFFELWNFGNSHLAGKKRVNYDKFEIATNCVYEIFNLNAFFFFLLTGASWYTIYLVFTYFALFTDYEDEILEVISNLHVQRSKFGGKIDKFDGKSKEKLNSTKFMELVFSKSGLYLMVKGIRKFQNRFCMIRKKMRP